VNQPLSFSIEQLIPVIIAFVTMLSAVAAWWLTGYSLTRVDVCGGNMLMALMGWLRGC